LLTYVARQAQPREIKILMQPEGNYLRLRVEHDGVGVSDADREPPGFALFSIRERLDRIGGTVAVESLSGRGMVITLRVPLRQAAMV
jgi:signal transduction histidine kinase